jgi:hypothetical protein
MSDTIEKEKKNTVESKKSQTSINFVILLMNFLNFTQSWMLQSRQFLAKQVTRN